MGYVTFEISSVYNLMSQQHEETVSTKFILGLCLVLGSFFWIHHYTQSSQAPSVHSVKHIQADIPEHTKAEIVNHTDLSKTALIPDQR